MSGAVRVMFLFIVMSLVPATGCSSAIKQAIREVRGATAEVKPVTTPDALEIQKYRELVFAAPTTTLSEDLCPPKLFTGFDEAIRDEDLVKSLAESFPGGEPRLRVSSEIQYFQSKGLMSSGLMLARVRMEGEGGRLVLDAVVKTESGAFTRGAEGALSAGMVRGIVKYLAKFKDRADARHEPESRQAAGEEP